MIFLWFQKIFYLLVKCRREIKELYLTSGILRLAASMAGVFTPVYFFEVFGSVKWVIIYFIVLRLVLFFVYPLGAKFACRFGFEHSIALSIPFLALYFVSLNLMAGNIWYVVPQVISSVLYMVLFWPAFHSDLAHYGHIRNTGTQYAFAQSATRVASVLGPLLGGLVVFFFGFPALFWAAAAISFLAVVPIFTTKERFRPSRFSYGRAFVRIFQAYRPYKRKFFLSFFGLGENMAHAILWPIFIFLVVQNYASLGAITSASIFVALFFSIFVGRSVDGRDKPGRKKLLSFGAIIYAFLWPLRAFLSSVWSVFLINIVSNNVLETVHTPLMVFAYQKGEERGHMKYVIFREMSLCLGTIAICGIFLLLVSLFGLNWYFLFGVAGLWSLFYLFL